jgi:hypothetical protein
MCAEGVIGKTWILAESAVLMDLSICKVEEVLEMSFFSGLKSLVVLPQVMNLVGLYTFWEVRQVD